MKEETACISIRVKFRAANGGTLRSGFKVAYCVAARYKACFGVQTEFNSIGVEVIGQLVCHRAHSPVL